MFAYDVLRSSRDLNLKESQKKSKCNILLAKFNYDEKKKIHYLKYEYYDKKIEDYKEDHIKYMKDLIIQLSKF